MASSISVVIPNYNGKDLLAENLPHLFSALATSQISDFEVIIADDASTDGSYEYVNQHFPSILFLKNDLNLGFSGNINRGIRAASKDWVFALNSDVQLTDHYFTPQLALLNHADTFGVMGKIIGLQSDHIQDGAKFPAYHFGNITATKNYITTPPQTLHSFFLSGANALLHREKLQAMGCFSEIYNPYYSEDVDLGLRAWRLGYKLYWEPRAVCRHPNSATIKKQASKKVKIISKRNKILLHFIHLNGAELAFFLVSLCLKTLLRSLLFDGSYATSFWHFIKKMPEAIQAKKHFRYLQKQKNVSLRVSDIATYIKQTIANQQIDIF